MGARVVLAPATVIQAPQDAGAALRATVGQLDRYRWVAFTSANAVRYFLAALEDVKGLARTRTRLAAVGKATQSALVSRGLQVDLVAGKASAEGLVADFPDPAPDPTGGSPEAEQRVLFPRAAGARPTLADGLRAKGWLVDEVVAYQTVPAPSPSPELAEQIAAADAVVFAAPSAVGAFLSGLRSPSLRRTGRSVIPRYVACIGPVTAEEAVRQGLIVDVVATEPSPSALARTLIEFRRHAPGGGGNGTAKP